MEIIITVIALVIAGLTAFFFGESRQKKQNSVADIPDAVLGQLPKIVSQAEQLSVPPDVAVAVMWQESAGKVNATGSAGEVGLFQIKEIAQDDVNQNFDTNLNRNLPIDNVEIGIRFLKLQFMRTGNWDDAIKAYNQGFQGMKVFQGKAQNYLNEVNDKRRKLLSVPL